MPVIHVAPPSETSQSVITMADVHAAEEELRTPFGYTSISTCGHRRPDSDVDS